MKKILFTLLFVGFLLSQSAFGADDFKLGRDAFNQKDYVSANAYFVRALTANPNDANCRYYYAQTLTYLKNYKQARKEYGYVIQLAPNTQLSNYAQQSITNLDSIMVSPEVKETLASDNYIKNAINNQGELVTWNSEVMPIKIYFDNSKRVNNAYVVAARDALNTWRAASDDNFNFLEVKDPQYADVIVAFQGMATKTENQILGLTNHNELNGYIRKATVNLYTLNQGYKPLADYDVYNIALHEFGHLLGISGHSNDENDVMHTTYSPETHNGRMQLSTRDVNTMKALYSIDKNPYSTTVNSINRVLGSKESRLTEKLNQSLDYVKATPGNPVGYVNVAKVYKEMDNESEAINYYKKALAISPNDYSANYNLAVIYYKREDLPNAEIYCKNLIKTKPKEVDAYYYLSDMYVSQGKISNARALINSLFYRNPSAKDDSKIKQVLAKINK